MVVMVEGLILWVQSAPRWKAFVNSAAASAVSEERPGRSEAAA